MDYGVTAIEKSIVASMSGKSEQDTSEISKHICTLDNYHENIDNIDASKAELPDEHKSFNLIELKNGQSVLVPDFKVSTQFYQVENGVKWGRLGDCDDYFWTTPDEREEKYEM